MCATCETQLKAEAAANGSEAPLKPNQRWEEVVFEQLLPLITYADGMPFPPDQRDERKGGGLGTSKAPEAPARVRTQPPTASPTACGCCATSAGAPCSW